MSPNSSYCKRAARYRVVVLTSFLLRILFLLILLTVIGKTDGFAQLPFYTDDADTTEKGKFHIEIYNEHDVLQRSAHPTKRQNTVVFTLDYGITNRLEFGVNAPLITFINSRETEPRTITGVGDTQFGLKYNALREREGSKLPALSVVFYVEAPTGDSQKQLGSGLTDYWLYGIVQKSLTKTIKARLNGGILFSGNSSTGLIGIRSERGHIYTGNTSVVRDFTDRLTLGLEVFGAVPSSFSPDRGQLTAQFGGDYLLTNKLTLSFGLLTGRFSASPRVGLHLGFAYDF
jgi:hypothetical protein